MFSCKSSKVPTLPVRKLKNICYWQQLNNWTSSLYIANIICDCPAKYVVFWFPLRPRMALWRVKKSSLFIYFILMLQCCYLRICRPLMNACIAKRILIRYTSSDNSTSMDYIYIYIYIYIYTSLIFCSHCDRWPLQFIVFSVTHDENGATGRRAVIATRTIYLTLFPVALCAFVVRRFHTSGHVSAKATWCTVVRWCSRSNRATIWAYRQATGTI